MRFLLFALLISVNAFAQTTWIAPNAYWKYYTATQGGPIKTIIEEIDSIIPNTSVAVLRMSETFSGSVNYSKKSFIYSKIKHQSWGDEVYFGRDTNSFILSYITEAYIGKSLGENDYQVDSIFTIALICGEINGYRIKSMTNCAADGWVNSAIFYEKIGSEKGLFFFSNTGCVTDRAYVRLEEYHDGSGFSYFNNYSTGSTYSCPTGIEDEIYHTPYTISPNPSSGITSIETSNPIELQYQIININGKTVLNGSFIQKTSFELPHQGLYILKIADNDKILYTGKIAKY